MGILEFQNVSKAYYTSRDKSTAQIALDNVSFSIEQGEFVCIVGPSGSGKTVTLNMMAGFERPTSGNVLYKGKPIQKPSPERGVVFQEASLLPWLTVEENILYALSDKNISPSEKRRAALNALRTVGLERCKSQKPSNLSGGMKQRAAIARVLAMDSSIMLMDEPFSALDEQTRMSLNHSLVNLWKNKKKTVVFITHNISEAIFLSTRIIMYSASPATIIQEWRLDANRERDPLSEVNRALLNEVREHLPHSLT